MQNLQLELIKLLEKDDRFTAEGKLLKNKVIEAALQFDPTLLKLLLSHKSLKKHFFREVDSVLVFDKIEFQKFVSNKSFLKDSYTAFSNKIGLTSDDEFISESKEVVLSWPHKDCVLEGGQTKEDEKRDEIFWNETLAPDEIDRLLSPKVFTNFKKYDSKGEHIVTDISLEDNLIIKGNNLLVLHSLLLVYRGIIRLIYIDPPYNTGNDFFNYNDNFNHSTWLTFMRNRLEIARELLSDDGVIFISCDDNEQAYLKILCDEIFGKDNFLSQIIVQSNKRGQTYKQISKTHEYLLLYTKSYIAEINELEKESDFELSDSIGGYELRELRNRNPKFGKFNRPNLFYPIYVNPQSKDEEGYFHISVTKDKLHTHEVLPLNSSEGESCWRWGNDKTQANIHKEIKRSTLIAKLKNTGEYGIYEKYRKKTYKVKSIWDEKAVISEQGTMELGKLGLSKHFQFPKPTYLIKKIIKLGSDENSIILDFFSGSGTTAQAVLEVNSENNSNRKFIICEQLSYVDKVTVPRIRKSVANDSFVYCELSRLNQHFVDFISKANTTKELKQIWETIKKDGFISYKVNPKDIDENISEFEELSIADQKKFLIEVLDKNHLYVNYSEIDDKDYKISDEDKKLNKKFYSLK